MRRRTLQSRLARQWVAFVLAVAVVFSAAALLLLFVLEDSFIDRRLRDTAALAASGKPLPQDFEAWPVATAPMAVRERMRGVAEDGIAEFRLADGRYLHVLRTRGAGGEPRLLAFDATEQLTVNAGLVLLAPWLAVALVALALLAWGMARWFVRGTAARATGLVDEIRSADVPALHRRAAHEPVRELANLADLFADAWEQRLDALQRERDTLAFLAHELRTPLQSARTCAALLEDEPVRAQTRERLRRAVDRLTRAADSVLWLSADADPSVHRADVAAIVGALAHELAPLAESRSQRFALELGEAGQWNGPAPAFESIAANLMLNAIQHGGPGTIALHATAAQFEVRNPVRAADDGTTGFGLGLELASRLCTRCGWTLERHVQEGEAVYRVRRDVGQSAGRAE